MATKAQIEHVAKAIKEALAKQEDTIYFRDDGDTCTIDGHVDVYALARAAIEAINIRW